jgi:hypothetical protein
MVQTTQSLIIDNTASIKDTDEVVSTLKLEKVVVNVQEYQRIKETIAPLGTYTVAFQNIVPDYIKIVANGKLEMTLGAADLVVLDVTEYEMT